ncbi:MAG: prepilin-type N-terminal cleavage/methylation domain-containing protein [Eubacteriales bacterium]
MTLKNKRTNGGFTLTEVIVTLVIIAILAAIMIPSLAGYINKAREKAAVAECRAAVVAAQTFASELYSEGKCTPTELIAKKSEIIKLAEIKGELIEVNCGTSAAKIMTLIYRASNGKYVLYKDECYTVSDDMPSGYTIVGYKSTSESLLADAIDKSDNKNNVWNVLRDLYKNAYGGANPSLSESERQYLAKLNSATLDSLTWKPTLLGKNGGDGILMIASSDSSSQNNAYMVYYNGSYYCHQNGYGAYDSKFVSDQGTFDVTDLTSPPASGARWEKIA